MRFVTLFMSQYVCNMDVWMADDWWILICRMFWKYMCFWHFSLIMYVNITVGWCWLLDTYWWRKRIAFLIFNVLMAYFRYDWYECWMFIRW